jgi:serine/threonine protein kinase
MVGKKILHYQLIDKIGAGGMGEIYKAQDSRLNRLVAVKILSPGLSTDPERKRRFFQEAQAASALNHPNIITLYDIVSEGDMQCIVMEYIGGKTLRDLTPAGGLSPAQVLQYATQIASALTAAHTAGIIHRDLKPSNIMVTTSGLIKVLDFGLAKWVDTGMSGQTGDQSTMETALTREGSIIGTVSYMSPEQAEGKRVDARSDIFSFGSVLYEMLTGKRAFEGRSGISTLSAILRDDVKPINQAAPDVPPLLEQIVLRCLYKDPAARWQSMKEIEGALLTLQRQLDPEGHFSSPLPTSSMTDASTPVAPPSIVQAAVSEAAPAALASVSTRPDPSIGSASPPGVAAPVNGPSKTGPSKNKSGPSPAGPGAPGGIQQPPAAPKQVVPRSSASSPKMLVIILGLIGAVLVAGAGVGTWYWWKSHQPSSQPVATAVVPPANSTIPAPAETKPSPLGNPPAEQPPAEPAPAVPATVPDANDASKAAKAKRTPKPKQDNTAKIVPPIPAPVAPVQPPPAPVAAPTPPPPTPPPPKPEIQTPVMVNDALPFVVNLAEDVPADAPEGQALHFTVKEGLQVGDKTVIAKGATVTGAVAGESGKKGFLGIGGHKLTFRLTQAEAVDGRKLAVRAMAGKNGDGPIIRPFDTGKASKSKGYAALQGTVYIAYIDGDQIVAVRK